MSTAQLASAQEALQEMLVRSASDMEFRAALLSDPCSAFAEYGYEVPEGIAIGFVENHHDATIVLPDPIEDMVEMTDEELHAINGGGPILSLVVISSQTCARVVVSVAVSVATYIISKEE